MDIIEAKEKLKKFQELVSLLKEINEAESMSFFFLKQDGTVRVSDIFRISDLINVDYIILIGTKTWENGPYTNWKEFEMGFLDANLDVVDTITFSNGWTLEELWFEDNGHYSYTKPVLEVRNIDGEKIILRDKWIVDLIRDAQSL